MLISSSAAMARSAVSPRRAATQEPNAPVESFQPARDTVPPRLDQALRTLGKPYYDEARDRQDRERYYAGLSQEASPAQRYDELQRLVQRTHTTRFGFDPVKRLFPWVDLRPNLRLQSIYSAESVAIDTPVRSTKGSDFIRKVKVEVPGRPRANGEAGPPRRVNKKIDFRQQAREWTKIMQESPLDALRIAQQIAAVEGHRYFNAEHSVPQWFFDGDRVPKGDLHHLFTCERNTNSLRGCRPYGEVEQVPENRGREGWSPKHENAFEPDAGKGAVARAALYFLLRYPGKIGDQEGEYTPRDLDTLLRWHRENPVSLYELHRNQAIAELQGNRNPFIDHPEWAEQVDFSRGFYQSPSS